MEINIENIEELVNNAVEYGISSKEAGMLSIQLKQANEQTKEVFHQALNTKFEQISEEINKLTSLVNA
ncbi:MAG: hypothetical protein OHK0057_05590 [Thermoflexibacter sp.]|uniref:Uncharacterized protein n=1 Tax=Thermoflexibacter ruber TaxID=1003 RepID=A0A1I2H6C2_9BACT|nr:hypothetical protein [Thermoflexibacter ruber]SFF24181.1 hypothetical protein SAMN04488541_102178 [Thermoflexibacter ruber]